MSLSQVCVLVTGRKELQGVGNRGAKNPHAFPPCSSGVWVHVCRAVLSYLAFPKLHTQHLSLSLALSLSVSAVLCVSVSLSQGWWR